MALLLATNESPTPECLGKICHRVKLECAQMVSQRITVDLNDFPNVNMWTPPEMPFACIEPMVGHQDVQNSSIEIDKKPYLIALPAGKKKTYSFSIIVNE